MSNTKARPASMSCLKKRDTGITLEYSKAGSGQHEVVHIVMNDVEDHAFESLTPARNGAGFFLSSIGNMKR